MHKEQLVCWDNALAYLSLWHDKRCSKAGNAVLGFIEGELRQMIPVMVRRLWTPDMLEDAIRDFLTKLVEKPLPEGVDSPRAYLKSAFRNHCIDQYRVSEQALETSLESVGEPWEDVERVPPSPLEETLADERKSQVLAAVDKISIVDRVALKLELAPEWLTEDEIDWLAKRTGKGSLDVRVAVVAAEDMHALSRVFDAGDDDPKNPELRRKRMERFRRRRGRAREKLRVIFMEECL